MTIQRGTKRPLLGVRKKEYHSTNPLFEDDAFQPMQAYYGGLNDVEEQEILDNVSGFFALLHQWQEAEEQEREQAQEKPLLLPTPQPTEENETDAA